MEIGVSDQIWMNAKLSKHEVPGEHPAFCNPRLWSLLMFRLPTADFSLESAFKIARALDGIWSQPLPADCHCVNPLVLLDPSNKANLPSDTRACHL